MLEYWKFLRKLDVFNNSPCYSNEHFCGLDVLLQKRLNESRWRHYLHKGMFGKAQKMAVVNGKQYVTAHILCSMGLVTVFQIIRK